MAYTNIDDPSAYFQTKLYVGTSGLNIPVTHTNDGNSDLQPDLIWGKDRSTAYGHYLCDSSRGRSKYLYSEAVTAEVTTDAAGNDIVSFDTNGFKVGAPSAAISTNAGNGNKVAWQWKANGGSKGTNSDGSTDATVQVNQDAGFSIVEFTTDGGNETYGHGLGVKPDIVIVKSRSGAGSWIYMTDVIDGSVDYLLLNTNAAAADLSYGAFTSSTFQYNDNNAITQLAYCFAEKQGYSKFGKYVGNGNDNGPFVYTGFKPAWIMVKNIDSGVDHWHIIDNKRNPNNVAGKLLFADLDSAEITYTTEVLFDILSNGFKLRGDYDHINKSGENIIYMAFAENPFVTSTGIPTTAR